MVVALLAVKNPLAAKNGFRAAEPEPRLSGPEVGQDNPGAMRRRSSGGVSRLRAVTRGRPVSKGVGDGGNGVAAAMS